LGEFEAAVSLGSFIVLLQTWIIWYRDTFFVSTFRSTTVRWILASAPVFCLLPILWILGVFAASSVRVSPFYLGFYLLVGAAWLGLGTSLLPFLGISARDDAIERDNAASAWAVVGALCGISFAFAGGNVGEGPGVEAVLLSAALSTALFFALWLLFDRLTAISDAITIDRSLGAGIRLAGFLMAIGVLSGWSVAGDWVSFAATARDFRLCLWPAVVWTVAATVCERVFPPEYREKLLWSLLIGMMYMALAVAWVFIKGVKG
jgi:hypothetical protein